jgi:hypothetical protein
MQYHDLGPFSHFLLLLVVYLFGLLPLDDSHDFTLRPWLDVLLLRTPKYQVKQSHTVNNLTC